jgi:hypothetical protein
MGVGAIIKPSGDIKKDFEIIKNFYKNIEAKYPENKSVIKIKPK